MDWVSSLGPGQINNLSRLVISQHYRGPCDRSEYPIVEWLIILDKRRLSSPATGDKLYATLLTAPSWVDAKFLGGVTILLRHAIRKLLVSLRGMTTVDADDHDVFELYRELIKRVINMSGIVAEAHHDLYRNESTGFGRRYFGNAIEEAGFDFHHGEAGFKFPDEQPWIGFPEKRLLYLQYLEQELLQQVQI